MSEDRVPKDLRGVTDDELRRHSVPPPFRPLRPRSKHYPLRTPLAVPAVREHFTARPHRFHCPACHREYIGVYRPEKPLPVCMGGERSLHPRWMLVSEVYDEYQHMRARFERGDPTTRPIINPRTAGRFEVRPPAERLRDIATPTTSPRG